MAWIKAGWLLVLSSVLVTGGILLFVYLVSLSLSVCCVLPFSSVPPLLLANVVFCLVLLSALLSGLLMPFLVKGALGVQAWEETAQGQVAMRITRELAQRLGVKPPRLYRYTSAIPNAFVLGFDHRHADLLLSSALLERASDAELRAAIAHEIGHIYSGDMLSMQLLQGTTIVLGLGLSQILTHLFQLHQPARALPILLLQMLFLVFSWLPTALFSRRRELRADRFAAEQYGAAGMISLLRNHAAAAENEACFRPLAFLSMFGVRAGIFSSHPAAEKRIAALQKFE